MGCRPHLLLTRRRPEPRGCRWFGRDAMAAFLHECIETAELLVSELVTNAVQHAQTAIRLLIHLDDGRINIAVEDASTAHPQPHPPSDDATYGRGLQVVDAQSTSWGWHQIANGKRVWFELQPR
jgi:hypothetical protein